MTAPPTSLIEMLVAYRKSAVLRAVLDLSIPDCIEAGNETLPDLAAAVGAESQRLRVLMDAFCALGLATKEGDRYRLAPDSRSWLVKGPGSLAGWSDLLAGEPTWSQWSRLAEVIKTGEPLLTGDESESFWRDYAMVSLEQAMRSGEAALKLLGVQPGDALRILDLGCGSGGFGFAFAKADPAARVTLLDRPKILEVARKNAEGEGVLDATDVVATDLDGSEGFGVEEYDLAVISEILPGRNRAQIENLLGRVRKALVPRGRLVISQIIVQSKTPNAGASFLALQVLLRNGFAHLAGLPELKGLLASCGFQMITTSGSIIIATKLD